MSNSCPVASSGRVLNSYRILEFGTDHHETLTMQVLISNTSLLTTARADVVCQHAPALCWSRSPSCWRHRLPAPCPVPTLAVGYLCRPDVRVWAGTTVYDTDFVAAVNEALFLTPPPPPLPWCRNIFLPRHLAPVACDYAGTAMQPELLV